MKTKEITLSGIFLLLGLILPFVTGQIPQFGSMLLPIHLPVMLAGLCLPMPNALLISFLLPIVRSLLFTMPPMYPSAIAMAFELGTYAIVINYIFKRFKKKNTVAVYCSLIPSMLLGRFAWGAMMYMLTGIVFEAFLASAFINALPGIVLQLVLIPLIMNFVVKNIKDNYL